MKKISSYLLSLLLSVLLVFAIFVTSLITVFNMDFKAEKAVNLAHRNNISEKIISGLEKYYKDKYNTSGVPADIYMNALDEEYIYSVVEVYINGAFNYINDHSYERAFFVLYPKDENYPLNYSGIVNIPENQELEKSLDDFYSDYAESIGYEKDEAYEKKLSEAKSNAYKTIGDYCDIYKFAELENHRILTGINSIYSNYDPVIMNTIAAAGCAFIILLLLIVNRKEKKSVLYWIGISSIIGGLAGAVPCAYLIKTDYFSRFSIKQPQIFTTFTTSFSGLAGSFMNMELAVIAAGTVILIIYAVISRVHKN